MVLPGAENVCRAVRRRLLVLQHIGVVTIDAAELFGRVHVKEKQPVRVEVIVDRAKTEFQIAVCQEIIEAVEAAGDRADCTVQLKRAQILLQKQRAGAIRLGVVGNRQHVGAAVDPDHVVAAPRQFVRHAPGPAGKIQHQLRLFRQPARKAALDEIRPCAVVDFPAQQIVNASQRAVALAAAHSSVAARRLSRRSA